MVSLSNPYQMSFLDEFSGGREMKNPVIIHTKLSITIIRNFSRDCHAPTVAHNDSLSETSQGILHGIYAEFSSVLLLRSG